MRVIALLILALSFVIIASGRTTIFTPRTANISHLLKESSHAADTSDLYTHLPASGLDWDPAVYANDEQWMTYVHKGKHSICLMQATDAGAASLITNNPTPNTARSPFRDALKRWGWNQAPYETWWECDFERQDLLATFQGLGLNAKPTIDDQGQPTEEGHNECFSLAHYNPFDYVDPSAAYPVMKPVVEQQYQVDGKWMRATGAYFEFGINKVDGAILGRTLNSPKHAVLNDKTSWGREVAPGELPEVRHASDVFWGYWCRGNPQYRNLRYYGANNVINEATVLLATRALKNAGETLSGWPGVTFSAETDEAKALIASPIGNTIVHLLVRRKEELGIKHVTKVTVVSTDNPKKKRPELRKTDLHLFFHIADYEGDEVGEEGGREGEVEE